jgi:hypothetical protein
LFFVFRLHHTSLEAECGRWQRGSELRCVYKGFRLNTWTLWCRNTRDVLAAISGNDWSHRQPLLSLMQTRNEMRQHVVIFYGAFILVYTGLIHVGGWDTQERTSKAVKSAFSGIPASCVTLQSTMHNNWNIKCWWFVTSQDVDTVNTIPDA